MSHANTDRHIHLIDSLRGLAAMSVALFHFNEVGIFETSIYQTIAQHGRLGVPAFFVISGFVVQASLERSPTRADFLLRRFWRIYPPYIASVVLVLLIIIGRKLSTGVNDVIAMPFTILGWLETLTLTTHPVTATMGLNWVYWSLSYEVAFYLILGVTFGSIALRRFVLLTLTAIAIVFPHIPLFFLDQWSLFALGVGLALLRKADRTCGAILTALCVSDLILNRSIAPALTGAATAATIWLASHNPSSLINARTIISRVGVWSYSLYLTHVPIGCFICLYYLDSYPRLRSSNSFAVHVAIDGSLLAICLAFAYVFWKAVELPASRLASSRRL